MSVFWSVFRATISEFLSGYTKYIIISILVFWFLLFFFTTSIEVETEGKVKTFRTVGARIETSKTDLLIMGKNFKKGTDILCSLALIVSLQLFTFILIGVSSARNIITTLSKGMVEFVLTQPLPRWQFFLYKYLATVTFFSCVAFLLILSNWLVGLIKLREISFSPHYGFVYIFILYGSIIALVYLTYGLTANMRLTTGIPIVIITIAGVLHTIYKTYSLNSFGFFETKLGWGIKTAMIFYHILPKVGELQIEGISAIAGNGISFSYALWSSLIFLIATLIFGLFLLCKRDY